MEANNQKPPLREPGDFHYVEERIRNEQGQAEYVITGMVYLCPCGCSTSARMNFKETARTKHVWNQNQAAPTVSPATPKCPEGHSYWLQDGVFTEVTEF